MDEPTDPAPRDRQAAARDSELEHEIMAACIDAWHDGGSGAVEAVLAAHQDLAPLLRARLEKLQRAGLLGPRDGDEETAVASEVPEQLGEFKLGKRLGSGGMGIVYVAEQLSLGRTVALKLVRPEQRFFPGARARFRREVEAIARLGDAGIVPIHCVGEDQGIDFFAMEYVRGASLGDVIAAVHGTSPSQLSGRDVAVVAAARAELPVPEQLSEVFAGTWVQTCCRLVLRMARAVHHAHERGVVHRDLKPNNTMVTPDGRVLLLDFGLAAAAGTSRITRSGAMLGTLHYMAPEQLLDGVVDARTDVYALGVTLHELLALRPPFHEPSQERLRQQILHGTAAPLRQQNPDVPRDVETIVAVARDRDRARRYATAEALAADLERFLQHRPIHARPIGVLLRSVRWSQRHPALATAAVLLSTALVAAPFLVQWTRGRADEQIASAQREALANQQRAQASRQQAQANLKSALEMVARMLQQARSTAFVRTPGLDQERFRSVREATDVMVRLRQENPDDVGVVSLFVRGMIRVAEFRRLVGEYDGSLAALAEVEPLLAELRTRLPDDSSLRADVAGLLLGRGSALVELGRVEEAVASWQRLVDECTALDGKAMTTSLRMALASAHNNLSRVDHGEGRPDAAIAHLQRGFAYEAEVPAAEFTTDMAIDSARSRINLAGLLRAKGDLDGAFAELVRVEAALTKLASEQADEPELRRELARTHAAMAVICFQRKETDRAKALRERSLATMAQLVQSFPERIAYRQELGVMAHDAANERQQAQDLPGAEALSQQAVAVHEALLQKQPDNPEFQTQLAMFLRLRSLLALLQQRPEPAFADLQRAVAMQDAVVAARPADPYYRMQAAGLLQELGVYHLRGEQWRPGRDALRRAGAHYEAALALGHAPAQAPRCLPKLLTVLSQAERMCDDLDGVMAALQRLQQIQPLPAAALRDAGEKMHLDAREDFRQLLQQAEARAGAVGGK